MRNLRTFSSLWLLMGLACGLMGLACAPASAQLQPAPGFAFTFEGSNPYTGVDVANLGGTYTVTATGTAQTVFFNGTDVEQEDTFYTIAKNGIAIVPQLNYNAITVYTGPTTGVFFDYYVPVVPDYNPTHAYTFVVNFGGPPADRNFQRLGASYDARDYDHRSLVGVAPAAAPEPGSVTVLGLGGIFTIALAIRRRTRPRIS